MASATVEKTAEELRKEIAELQRQQQEITERLRDPRGIRRSGPSAGPTGPRKRGGAVRPEVALEHQSAPKRRLSSAVVKLDGGETNEEASGLNGNTKDDVIAEAGVAPSGENNKARPNPQNNSAFRKDIAKDDVIAEVGVAPSGENIKARPNPHNNTAFRKDGNPWTRKGDYDILPTEPVPRILPKDEDPSLVKRNRRMLGQLLGTLEKFRDEDKQLAKTEAYMRRSDSLRRAEEKAREESERLRQQEREQIAEKRRRDLTLRVRVAAKAEQKKMELLFIYWSEHHKKLSNFLRTKTEPPIYYMPAKPLVEDAAKAEQNKQQVFLEWKNARRAELSEYQRQIEENYIANVDKEHDKWQNARNARRSDSLVNLQETMDKELETHQLEHGPKPRRIPGSNVEEEDVEDIVAEDELMDEVLGAPRGLMAMAVPHRRDAAESVSWLFGG